MYVDKSLLFFQGIPKKSYEKNRFILVIFNLQQFFNVKSLVDNILELRPTPSALNTATYKVAQVFCAFAMRFTRDMSTGKEPFDFRKIVIEHDCDLYIGSLDIDSSFHNWSTWSNC